MADPAAAAAAAPMTIDFLRARLLSERSVSRASKDRADQLAARVAELEEQVREVTAQRRQAEREAAEVLALLQSQGFCASLGSGSDNDSDADEEQDNEPRHAVVTRSHGEEGQEQEQPPAKVEAEEEKDALSGTMAQQEQPGGLSWKGRCASPRKARQLRQRHRRSYVYILASEPDPSPKYRLGQSCRKNKRKELSSAAVPVESRKEQRDAPRCADDGRSKFDGEVAGDDQRSSGDGDQYVVRYDNDGEMERVLEKQAELIGQHEAQEKAQTDWERQFNGSRSSPANKGDVEEDCQVLQDKSRGENSDGSSNGHTNSVSSAIKAPSESSPSISKASDWSSSRFHDHAADDDTRSCRRWSGDVADVESVLQALQRARISLRQKLDRPLPPSQVTLALPAPGDEYRGNEDDLCSNGNSSYRGSSPCRQEMLALPAPEDYHGHGYHDHENGSSYFSADGADTCSSRPRQEFLVLPAPGDDRVPRDDDGEGEMKIPVGSLGLFRLPTDSFPKEETLSRSNGHDVELGLGDADGHDAYRHDGAGVPVKKLYDPHGTSGRCNVPPSSGASFLSGIPGLPEDLRKGRGGPLADADLFMQRSCDYTISNRWMSL